MKHSTLLKQLLILSLAASADGQAELLIPGGEADGPHANRIMVFDGVLNVWANELYGFENGREVIFENAGEVTIGSDVAPKSVIIRGDANTTWNGICRITGETSVLKEGSGTLKMNAGNTYSGGTRIKEGCVIAGGITSFGTGNIELSGGILDLAGYEITNEIQLSGGQLLGASTLSHQLSFTTNYTISQDISARNIKLQDGLELKVSAGATLSAEEVLELRNARALDLSYGGNFRGQLLVENDGILKLTKEGSTSISSGSTWHLREATVSGNLSTAPHSITAVRTAGTGSTLRISGSNSIAGALTLNGGTLLLSDTHATLHAETLVLSFPTNLAADRTPELGNSHTFLTYNRLISGTVTDYYDFFGIDEEKYELTVTAQGISITAVQRPSVPSQPQDTPPSIVPTPPENSTPEDSTPENTPPGNTDGLPDAPDNPGPTIPGATGNDNTLTDSEASDNTTPPNNDDPHGPIIDTSGNDPDDPHNNQNTETDNDNNTGEGNAETHPIPEHGTPLGQAAMQSAWGSRFAAHAFMTAVHDNSRSAESTTWAAFYGGLMETDDSGSLQGGDVTAYGLAIGAETHPTERTQLGLAVGGALGCISGESFGELDQLSLHAAAYARHSFLNPDSRYRLKLYGAIGISRTETDPGIYSGLENWHHNSFSAHTRLSWGKKLRHNLIWEVYGSAEYYRGSKLSVENESISGISALRGSIGSGLSLVTKQTTLYAETEFTGDILRDTPNAHLGEREYLSAAPDRCGIRVSCGVQLHPADTKRSIRFNYSFETRGNSSAHVINAGFTQVF